VIIVEIMNVALHITNYFLRRNLLSIFLLGQMRAAAALCLFFHFFISLALKL